jgi:hypothetical protein
MKTITVPGFQRFRPEPLKPPLKPLFPPLVIEFRNDPDPPRPPVPAEPRKEPPLDPLLDRNAGALTAEEGLGPLWIPEFPGFTAILPPLPEKDRELLPRWIDGTPPP